MKGGSKVRALALGVVMIGCISRSAQAQGEPPPPLAPQPPPTQPPGPPPGATPQVVQPAPSSPPTVVTPMTPPPGATLPPPPATEPAPAASENAPPRVGGHIGAVLPLVVFQSGATGSAKSTTAIGDDMFTVALAAGVTVHLSNRLAVDFESVVGEPLHPKGSPAITIDPGIVYDAGPVAVGARIATHVGDPAPNIGLIPLVNKGFSLGCAAWFIEADFPVFIESQNVNLTIAVHSGFGF
jgi:hypothetical protein